jgi:hypothetical protein
MLEAARGGSKATGTALFDLLYTPTHLANRHISGKKGAVLTNVTQLLLEL